MTLAENFEPSFSLIINYHLSMRITVHSSMQTKNNCREQKESAQKEKKIKKNVTLTTAPSMASR